jgi:acyl-CoA thioesterase I
MLAVRLFALLPLLALAACAPERQPVPDPETAGQNAQTEAEPTTDPDNVVTIVYLGDSLTAGYGLAGGPEQAYPALIQARLDSLGIPARSVNAGVSGDTSAGGRSRLGWYLDRYDVDVLVVALGANDGLRGLPVATMRENLTAIIEDARDRQPGIRIVLAGMMTPPSMGQAYFREFEQVFPELAREHDVALVPFLLDGVAAVPELNQPDGVHPTARGQERMAEIVWPVVHPIVEEVAAQR